MLYLAVGMYALGCRASKVIYEIKSTFIKYYKGGSIRFREMTLREKSLIIVEEHKRAFGFDN
jgi:hypothetical protein